MNRGILAVRILWLLTLCILVLALTTDITGLWLAVAGLVVFVVCEAFTPSPEAKRKSHIARLVDKVYQPRRRPDHAATIAQAGAIEAELAQLRVRLLREHPELF